MEYLAAYFIKDGCAPCYRDISKAVGLSISTIHKHLEQMEKEGAAVE